MTEVKSKPNLHARYIDPRAYEMIDRLQKKGFTTYLVGGCVRDLLLNIEPKDFDIATTALPQEVKKIISNSYIIGKRFKLVLAKRGRDQFEIATFRKEAPKEEFEQNFKDKELVENISNKSKKISNTHFVFNDNFFGTPEEDALRRDFTINALFYDPIKNELIDYTQGVSDLKNYLIRMIGDPDKRILEDPIRSLRAIRLAHKINFTIEPKLRLAIQKHSPPVVLTALPRRREEYIKLLKLKYPSQAFFSLYDLGLIEVCLPSLTPIFKHHKGSMLLRYYLDYFKVSYEDPVFPNLSYIIPLSILLFDWTHSWGAVENFLKTEFGAYKGEIAVIQNMLRGIKHFPQIESFKKRSLRRKINFLNQPWVPYAFEFFYFKSIFSSSQMVQWNQEFYFLKNKTSLLAD